MAYHAYCECGAVEISTCHCTLTMARKCESCEHGLTAFNRRHRQCDLFTESLNANPQEQKNSGTTPEK